MARIKRTLQFQRNSSTFFFTANHPTFYLFTQDRLLCTAFTTLNPFPIEHQQSNTHEARTAAAAAAERQTEKTIRPQPTDTPSTILNSAVRIVHRRRPAPSNISHALLIPRPLGAWPSAPPTLATHMHACERAWTRPFWTFANFWEKY